MNGAERLSGRGSRAAIGIGQYHVDGAGFGSYPMQPESFGRKRRGVILTMKVEGMAMRGYCDWQRSGEGVQSSD